MINNVLPDILPRGCDEFAQEAWQDWRAGVLERFAVLRGDGPAERPPAKTEIEEEVAESSWTRRLIAYDCEPGDRCRAWVLIPHQRSQPAPAVLCLHGTTADAKDACLGRGDHPGGSNGVAVHLAKRGFVTMAPDHFCAGQRLPVGNAPYNTAFFYEKHPEWSEMGKDIFDHRQALDVLCDMPEVNRDCIGCIGHSLGGYGTIFLTLCDQRVRAAVSSCGITSWHLDPLRDNWSRTAPGRYKHFPALRPYFEADSPPPLDFHEILAAIAPRPLLNISAVGNDQCFPIFEPFADIYCQVERVYKALKAEGRFCCLFHSETHSFNSAQRALAYRWLEVHLGMPVDLD